ncbi:MAG: ABC transporter permease [Bacteroidetes bacterium]|nr:ABC transporter permease [Bacteroidota bacterium]
MLANYCRIIFRNFGKTKLYVFINILSLGIGIAAMIWGIQVYRFNTSYDRFHQNREHIFRVLIRVAGGEGLKGTCPSPVSGAAVKDFPGVEKAVRWQGRPSAVLAAGSEPFAVQVHYTDPDFFTVFTFPMVRGTAQLGDLHTVVITETGAKKFFGKEDPLGKTLVLYSDQPYKRSLTVTGIVKDPPANSSFQFETLTSMDNFLSFDGSPVGRDDWRMLSDAVFLKLTNPGQAATLGEAFSRYIPLEQAARQDIKVTSFALQSLSKTAEQSGAIDINAMLERPSDAGVYAPLILAVFILLSACLNFANTTVAQSRRRLKEIGIRKVMGSSLRQILLQQLLECALIVVPAIGLAMLLDWLWLPVYNGMMIHSDVQASYSGDPVLQLVLAGLFVAVVFVAGAYPAFYISRFNATSVFRGVVRFGGANLFSRFLLGLQIVVTFITLVTSIAFARNAAFQRDYDYGYHRKDIMGIWLREGTDGKTLRDELSRMPGVEQMEGVNDQVGFSYHSWPLEAEGKKKECTYLEVGPGYISLMELKLVAGSVPKTISADRPYMLINEKLAFALGWKPVEAIGRTIRKDEKTTCVVAGVLKDFTQNSFGRPILPVAMELIDPEKASQLLIRARPGRLGEVSDEVRAAWARLYPGTPFNGYFQDDVSVISMRLNAIVTRIFSGCTLISIFMAATGMFALVSLTVLKRRKEIAVRKVVGARGRHILSLVGMGYGWTFLISAFLGCTVGYLLARQLMEMIFRINAGVRMDSVVISFLSILLLSGTIILTRVWYLSRVRTTDLLKEL